MLHAATCSQVYSHKQGQAPRPWRQRNYQPEDPEEDKATQTVRQRQRGTVGMVCLPSCSHDGLADEREFFPLSGCPDQPDSGGNHTSIDATLALLNHVLNHRKQRYSLQKQEKMVLFALAKELFISVSFLIRSRQNHIQGVAYCPALTRGLTSRVWSIQ